jgi:lipoprotein signal peptidase
VICRTRLKQNCRADATQTLTIEPKPFGPRNLREEIRGTQVAYYIGVPGAATARRRLAPGSAFLACALGVATADLITKHLAATLLGDRVLPIPVLGDSIRLAVVLNDQSAFGVSLGPYTWHLNLAFTFLAIVLSVGLCRALSALDGWAPIVLGLIAGAATGNLVSLVFSRGGVIDFVAVRSRAGNELVFNLADVAAMLGLILILRSAWTVTRAIAARTPVT